MRQLFNAIAQDAGDPEYGPEAWFRWVSEDDPQALPPEWLEGKHGTLARQCMPK